MAEGEEMVSPHQSGSASQKAVESRLGLNDNKAGMEGLDKEKINRIIIQASKGSRFYENELKKDKLVLKRVSSLKEKLNQASTTDLEACRLKADTLLKELRLQYDFTRYIVHMDMDAFYAAVEMRENPKLRDVPMAVGGEDMLSTSNYLARRFGVRAAMPGFIARKLCPQLVIVPTNFQIYRSVSRQIRAILKLYDPNMSPLSLDEAYIDFTNHMVNRGELSETERTFPVFSEDQCRCEPEQRQKEVPATSTSQSDADTEDEDSSTAPAVCDVPINTRVSETINQRELEGANIDSALVCSRCGRKINTEKVMFGLDIEEAVREMRHRIHLKTRLTASAGIACNCMLAKICSDKNKPNGQYRLDSTESATLQFMSALPIRKVPGIGKVSEKQLTAFGIRTCKDFHTHRDILGYLFSDTSFDYFMSVYLGIGSNFVGRSEEGPKSKSVERTFRSMSDPAELLETCHKLSLDLSEDLKKSSLSGRTVTLKIKLVTFTVKTRAQSLSFYTDNADKIYQVASSLLKTEMKLCQNKPLTLRLMGVRMSNFGSEKDKQKKLTVIKSAACGSKTESLLSFFDAVAKERKSKAVEKEETPLGLFAYMNEVDRQSYGTKSVHTNPADKQGITKYTTNKFKSVWDNLDILPPEKALKPGTKGTVTICSLLDSDSSTAADPWKDLETPRLPGPLSSTPYHKTANKGPLDSYCSTNEGANPWKSLGEPVEKSETMITKSNPRKRRLVNALTNDNTRPVSSYFGVGATKSVWEQLDPSSDDDIVCLSDKADSVMSNTKVKQRKHRQKQRQPKKSPATATPFTITLRSTNKTEENHCVLDKITPNKNSQITPDVIVLSD